MALILVNIKSHCQTLMPVDYCLGWHHDNLQRLFNSFCQIKYFFLFLKDFATFLF